jgi:hypothetical protein
MFKYLDFDHCIAIEEWKICISSHTNHDIEQEKSILQGFASIRDDGKLLE